MNGPIMIMMMMMMIIRVLKPIDSQGLPNDWWPVVHLSSGGGGFFDQCMGSLRTQHLEEFG